ncbi:MAG: ABC transporter substrate-binding protein [candidate division WOR-3 bacterium]
MLKVIWSLAALTFFFTGSVCAKEPVKIGLITVLSGPLAPIGINQERGARMAVEEFGPVLGQKVELISKDHQFNPGLANERAKELFEKDKVDVIVGVSNSAAALAVSDQAAKYKKILFASAAGTTELIGRNRYTFKYNYNDYMLANTVGRWGAKNLGKKWYTITADYAWGHDLLKHFTAALKEEGGIHVGNDMVAVGTSDFSPYVLKAMRAEPDVLVLLNVGKDTVNATKAAVEYGLKKKAKIVHALLFEIDIKGAGLELFEDNYVAASWNWRVDHPGAREFGEKYYKRFGEPPTFMAAADYSAVWQYLSIVQKLGTKDTEKVISALRGHRFVDMFAAPGYIRPQDHLQVAKAYILRVKKAHEVKQKDDFFEIVGSLPAEKAHPPVGLFGTLKD